VEVNQSESISSGLKPAIKQASVVMPSSVMSQFKVASKRWLINFGDFSLFVVLDVKQADGSQNEKTNKQG
jgi:hypothetical protein